MSEGNGFGRRKRVTFRTADGKLLHLSSKQAYFTNPADSTVQIGPTVLDGTRTDTSQVRNLHVAYSGNYDLILRDFIDAVIVQRLSSQGGELIVARSSRADLQGLVLWRGPHHEVASWLPPVAEAEGIDPIERFEGLRFLDSPEGLVIRAAGPDLYVRPLETVTDIDGVGTLYLYGADQALAKVPTWAGHGVGVGELWRSTTRNSEASAERTLFTVATPTVVATLAPAPDQDAPFTDQLRFIDSLDGLSMAGSA